MIESTWLNRCIVGDCREVLKRMIADGVKVQMCVTSPPYWGLRDYGTATWEGGRKGCDHKKEIKPSTEHIKQEGYKDAFRNQSARSNHAEEPRYVKTCGKCGARRIDQQLGLEATPELYVENMVEVFRLVREVLVDDGTLWIVIGDSYISGGGTGNQGKHGERYNRTHATGFALAHAGGLRAEA